MVYIAVILVPLHLFVPQTLILHVFLVPFGKIGIEFGVLIVYNKVVSSGCRINP